MTTLQVIWFLLIGVLLVGYAILDGFDLGVGFWHLFTQKDKERRAFMTAIGPFWDGNEVWLLTAGGALFAAFPPVYATVFSGFYLAMMLVLFGLIFRAVSLDFRSHVDNPTWRKVWDVGFAIGSTLPAILFGVALGNVMRGLPLAANGDYTGSFFDLLNPFSLLVGLTGFSMIITQGAWYLAIKIDGEVAARAQGWGRIGWLAFVVLLLATTVVAFITQPHLLRNFSDAPLLWLVPALLWAGVGLTGFWGFKAKPLAAFITHSATIALLMAVVGASIFPNMVPALNDPALSLTIMNASSSETSLMAMLVIALIGVPIVLGYTVWIYRAFAGKVRPGDTDGY
jgi:cytochrome d ubiquinol oxidase subunit II